MPDHPTPIELRTHTGDPVPFVIWGPGIKPTGASAYTEAEAAKTGVQVEKAHTLVDRLIKGS